MAQNEQSSAKVYRLRFIPEHLDRLGVANLVGSFLPSKNSQAVTVASLATSCDFWSHSPSKTATLTFSELPEAVPGKVLAREWVLPLTGLSKALVLDDSFSGFTPLNDVPTDEHKYDCIVLSGLASHPMGSWQPRGHDKSFMWIRDTLPKLLPSVRFILYGYDTTLVNSRSFQNIPDLALTLINEMKAGGWTSSAAKPTVFLAHSLGGVVLKQTFVLLADSSEIDKAILGRIKGAIFFGVPSQGMEISDIFGMLGSQPNKDALVKFISTESPYLTQLERQVFGISYVRHMKLLWAYETQTTPTIVENKGQHRRSGPGTVLVSKESATGGRCFSDPASTIQIDSNHSEMVKFSIGNNLISLIGHKLGEILGQVEPLAEHQSQGVQPTFFENSRLPERCNLRTLSDLTEDPYFWDVYSIAKSLRFQERDVRAKQIDDRTEHTFEWVFDQRIGLTTWLREGAGVFWISGRPASGKSTMMKFISNDHRTKQIFESWQGHSHQAHVSFFFHHRGNTVQKSFEGLLQSILSQLVENDHTMLVHIIPMLRERYMQLVNSSDQGSLSEDLNLLILDDIIKEDSSQNHDAHSILATELPRKMFYEIITSNMLGKDETASDYNSIEKEVLSRKDEILKTTNEQQLQNLKPPIWRKKWNTEIREKFLSLLLKWRNSVDLRGKLEHMMQLANLCLDDANPVDASSERRRRVELVLQRQHKREILRSDVETEIWSKARLHEAFKCIVEQRVMDRDICLFLDALDEYDGPPEFIAGFLKDLVKEREGFRTRIKILFSSRPWNVFVDEFKQYPGFRIHEHTQQDVRLFCAHTIHGYLPGYKEVRRLISRIVAESRGVFLWVRLVLQDLAGLAAKCIESGMSERNLRDKLEKMYDSIPRDLVDYYEAIIDRIPQHYRWDAYCIIESVCKSVEHIQASDVLDIMRCSTLTKLSQFHGPCQIFSRDEVGRRVQAVSGGLLELVDAQMGANIVPQLLPLHQTMLEYARRPLFKDRLLGQLSHITDDNGHTFLAKYLLCHDKCHITRRLIHHAHESENTTGISLYDILHNEVFKIIHPAIWPGGKCTTVSPVGFAVAGHLHLFLKEALEHDKHAVTNASDSFLSLILWSFDQSVCEIDEAVAMIHSLISHGFKVEQDPSGLIMMLARDRHDRHFKRTYDLAQLDKMSQASLSGCHDLEMDLSCLPAMQHTKCLHLSSPTLTEYLLDRGANPNSLNSEGQTPLDFLVDGAEPFLGFSVKMVYQKSVLLVQKNGLLCKTRAEPWDSFVNQFDICGFDTLPFRSRHFPKWRASHIQGSSLQGTVQSRWWPWSR